MAEVRNWSEIYVRILVGVRLLHKKLKELNVLVSRRIEIVCLVLNQNVSFNMNKRSMQNEFKQCRILHIHYQSLSLRNNNILPKYCNRHHSSYYQKSHRIF